MQEDWWENLLRDLLSKCITDLGFFVLPVGGNIRIELAVRCTKNIFFCCFFKLKSIRLGATSEIITVSVLIVELFV